MFREAPRPPSNANRFAAALRKLLSLKGEAQGFDFEVTLEGERPEYSFVKGERLWHQPNEVVSAAGTVAVAGVRNPDNSGVLVVVERMSAEAEAAAVDLQLRFVAIGGTSIILALGTGSMRTRDTRYPGGFLTTALAGVGTIAAAGATGVVELHRTTGANAVVEFGNLPFVLAPGSELFMCSNPVGAHTVRFNMSGYERSLESGELIPG